MNELVPNNKKRKRDKSLSLLELCSKEDWNGVIERAIAYPEEALEHERNDTPLALACREGAPPECIKALLEASTEPVHELNPSRGTPLHEAVVSRHYSGAHLVSVVKLLLEADEKLSGESACLSQDVDGHTPLHSLIRRKFHLNLQSEDGCWFQVLQLLVKRAPAAVGISDWSEYEEPPLVMALKANTYVGNEGNGIMFQLIEKRIHEAVACMLEHYPQAARNVLTGARGHYTALHSAVFHGRCPDTIHLLLKAEQQTCTTSNAALLANTQGELPLHFAAMRGESPRSIALLANAAPMAVLTRDASGLTPFHWLWIRFFSTLLALENERGETTVEALRLTSNPSNKYLDFASLERGDFDADLDMIRKLDPPVDFLQMRHTSPELLGEGSDAPEWANRCAQVLSRTRQRYNNEEGQRNTVWTRREAVISLFWTKVVSLLKAAESTMNEGGHFHLVQSALSCPSCPPPVAQLVCSLFPEELSMVDPSTGKLPLHYAASRSWHTWDWPRPEAEADQTRTSEPAAAQLLRGESMAVLQNAIDASPPQAARIADNIGRLALHHAIDSFVRACANSGRSYMVDAPVDSMLQALEKLVKSYPESLERRDGETKLYPFLQATAAATEYRSPPSSSGFHVPFPDEMPFSIVYVLLRENPSLVGKS